MGKWNGGSFDLQVSNTVNQSAEAFELQERVTALKHIWGQSEATGYLHKLFWCFKKLYFLVNDVENVTELAVIQTINYEKLILTELG